MYKNFEGKEKTERGKKEESRDNDKTIFVVCLRAEKKKKRKFIFRPNFKI